MSISHQQLKGVLITTLGVVCLAPDALIIRLVSADLWTLFFWRSLFMSAGMGLVAILRRRRSDAASSSQFGRTGWLSVLLYGINNLFFVIAVSNTTAANVFAIIGLTPLFAALLGLIFIGEWVPLRTWLAIVVCLGGITVIFSGSIRGGGLFGDLSAVVTACTLAGFFVCLRCDNNIDNFLVVSVATLLSALVALPLAAPTTITGPDFGFLLLAGLIMTPLSIGLITIGPKFLRAAEVSLIMLLEMFLSPMLIWLVLGEVPGSRTVIGGGVLLLTLLIHSLIAIKERKVAIP
jgi:drug/metabolite transporter (DMT)-like permease